MLTIYGAKQRFCDSTDRRSFLKIGALGLGGLSLAQLLQDRGPSLEHKTGRSQFPQSGDSDFPRRRDFAPGLRGLKPEAPDRIRGEFQPIPTNVPGIEICELMPRLAQMMDQFAIIRSIADSDGAHAATQCLSGYRRGDQQRLEQPSVGFVHRAGFGVPRSRGAAVYGPQQRLRPQALGRHRLSRQAGAGVCSGPARRRRHQSHATRRHHARSAQKPPKTALPPSTASAGMWTTPCSKAPRRFTSRPSTF